MQLKNVRIIGSITHIQHKGQQAKPRDLKTNVSVL